jgi:hypothetical protein
LRDSNACEKSGNDEQEVFLQDGFLRVEVNGERYRLTAAMGKI